MFRLAIILHVLIFSASLNAQQFISKEKAFADIDSLNAIMENVHYNLFLHIPEEDYNKRVSLVKESIGDSIEIKELILKIYYLTHAIGDSHTSPAVVQPVIRSVLVQPLFLPFSFIADENNKVFISGGNKGIPVGSRVMSINGKNISDVFQQACTLWGGQPGFRKEMAERFFSYFLFLNGLKPPFLMEYEDGDTVQKVEISEGYKFSETLALTLPQISRKAYNFTIPGEKTGCIEFNNMSGDWKVFGSFLDSVMDVIKEKKINTLAIDLRNNSGGNSMLGDLLLSYLTDKKFSLMGKRYWKISDPYKNYLLKVDSKSEYLEKVSGTVWIRGNCKPSRPNFRVKEKFKGNIYFITGPFTFSSANMLADGVKYYKLGTIIGEPTGEATNDFGEVYSFELPNSKIRMNCTTSFDIGVSCNDKISQPVVPDIYIPFTTESKLKQKDPAMEYIINHN